VEEKRRGKKKKLTSLSKHRLYRRHDSSDPRVRFIPVPEKLELERKRLSPNTVSEPKPPNVMQDALCMRFPLNSDERAVDGGSRSMRPPWSFFGPKIANLPKWSVSLLLGGLECCQTETNTSRWLEEKLVLAVTASVVMSLGTIGGSSHV
jgi:hypothetical protein